MADVTIDVSYNLNNGRVTYSIGGKPSNGDVTADYGKNTITWNASGNSGRWRFTNVEITPPVSTFSSSIQNNQVVVDDDDTNDTGYDKTYEYTLVIEEIQTHNTKRLDPQIINKTKPIHS